MCIAGSKSNQNTTDMVIIIITSVCKQEKEPEARNRNVVVEGTIKPLLQLALSASLLLVIIPTKLVIYILQSLMDGKGN